MRRREKSKSPLTRPLQQPLGSHQVFMSEVIRSSRLDKLMKPFFIAGLIFFAIYFGMRINQEVQLRYFAPNMSFVSESLTTAAATPEKIVISKVNMDLPIEETGISKGVWGISSRGASYLGISAKPGEKGTIIMYGHNTKDRFGPIRWLKSGDKIELQTSDGKKHIYVISKTMRVKPERMDVFAQKGETLILYTCDGFADLERFVILAKPIME